MRLPPAALLCLALLALPAPGFAAVITVSDADPAFTGIPATMAELLVDAGLPLKKTGKDSYTVEAVNLHCDYYSHMALDAADPRAGLPTGQCRMDSENKKDSRSGKPFPEAHALTDLVTAVQQASAGQIALSNCAMGYCGIFVRLVRCSVNTSVKTFDSGGRWICLFEDGR
jgi:hypothetical protein